MRPAGSPTCGGLARVEPGRVARQESAPWKPRGPHGRAVQRPFPQSAAVGRPPRVQTTTPRRTARQRPGSPPAAFDPTVLLAPRRGARLAAEHSLPSSPRAANRPAPTAGLLHSLQVPTDPDRTHPQATPRSRIQQGIPTTLPAWLTSMGRPGLSSAMVARTSASGGEPVGSELEARGSARSRGPWPAWRSRQLVVLIGTSSERPTSAGSRSGTRQREPTGP